MAGDFLPILQQFRIKWCCKDAEIVDRAGAGQYSGSLQAAGPTQRYTWPDQTRPPATAQAAPCELSPMHLARAGHWGHMGKYSFT